MLPGTLMLLPGARCKWEFQATQISLERLNFFQMSFLAYTALSRHGILHAIPNSSDQTGWADIT